MPATPARPKRSLVSFWRDLDSVSLGAEAVRFIGWMMSTSGGGGGDVISILLWSGWQGGTIVTIVCVVIVGGGVVGRCMWKKAVDVVVGGSCTKNGGSVFLW
jgi:hypothetical protein